MLSPSASGYHMQRPSGRLSAQARTETTGAHIHLYRQHSTQLQQPKKVDAKPVGHTPVTTQALWQKVVHSGSAYHGSQLSSSESTQHLMQLRGKLAQRGHFTMLFCSSVCFKTQRSLGSFQSESGHKESVTQHSSMSAANWHKHASLLGSYHS